MMATAKGRKRLPPSATAKHSAATTGTLRITYTKHVLTRYRTAVPLRSAFPQKDGGLDKVYIKISSVLIHVSDGRTQRARRLP
jgi:hypothetical protein